MKLPFLPIPVSFVDIESCTDANLGDICLGTCDRDYFECAAQCLDDLDCSAECTRLLDKCQKSCPCYGECPNGCDGCQNPVCDQKLTTVVSLNTYGSNNAFLLNPFNDSNLYDPKVNFTYEPNTEVYYSCYAVFKGRQYIFGGEENPRQISIVNECTLQRSGSLNFDFYEGTCLNWDDRQMTLCFDHTDNKNCYR